MMILVAQSSVWMVRAAFPRWRSLFYLQSFDLYVQEQPEKIYLSLILNCDVCELLQPPDWYM